MQLENTPELTDDEDDEQTEQTSLFRRGLELIQSEFEPTTWKAFWMIVIENHSTESVSQSLGIGLGAVRQAKYRVLKRLREEFGEVIH